MIADNRRRGALNIQHLRQNQVHLQRVHCFIIGFHPIGRGFLLRGENTRIVVVALFGHQPLMQRPEFIRLLAPCGERGFGGVNRTLPLKRQQFYNQQDIRVIVNDLLQHRIELLTIRAVVIGKRDDSQARRFGAQPRAVGIVKQQLCQLVVGGGIRGFCRGGKAEG